MNEIRLVTSDGGSFRLCACGCMEKTSNSQRTFRQGHDQRLIGILTRAELDGVEVSEENGSGLVTGSAISYGRRTLSTAGLLKLQRNIEAGKKKAAKRSGYQEYALVGQVKIGRWLYPAKRMVGGRVVRNTKRDMSGAWIETDATFLA